MCTPQVHDVLFGRGSGYYFHVGNIKFHKFINLYKEEYFSSEKSAKTKISRSIAHVIDCQSPPGRFLERDTKLDTWIEVGEKRTLEKITQALRNKKKKYIFVKTNSNPQEDSDAILSKNDLSVRSANERKSSSPTMSSNLPLQTEKREIKVLTFHSSMCVPQVHDVLFGRGKGNYNHVGNIKFHRLIGLCKEEYLSSEKSAKTQIARSILRAIDCQSPPGRFLERDPKSDTWIEVGEERILEKIIQALREKRKNYTFKKNISNRYADSDIIPSENDVSVPSDIERKMPSPNMSFNLPLQTKNKENSLMMLAVLTTFTFEFKEKAAANSQVTHTV